MSLHCSHWSQDGNSRSESSQFETKPPRHDKSNKKCINHSPKIFANPQPSSELSPFPDFFSEMKSRHPPVESDSSSDPEAFGNIPTVPQGSPSVEERSFQSQSSLLPPSPTASDAAETTPEASSEEDLPMIEVPNTIPETFSTFGLTREQRSTIYGKRYYFTFYFQGNLLFRAKVKGRNPSDPISISTKHEVHLRGGCEFYLIPHNDSTFFSLRKESLDGIELLNVTIQKTSSVLAIPPHSVVKILPEIGIPRLTLSSKRPRMTLHREWKLDFGRRFVIPSEKNAIFVIDDDRADHELLLVRKIGSAAFEVDIAKQIPEITGFAIGLSLCVAKFG
jgi:hypothetical protein